MAHARETYPAECCGVFVGRVDRSAHRVETVHVADNARESENQHNRFLIPPEVIARVMREAAKAGLDIIGYYHSHPDHPSQPSDYDREHAWPNTSYLIFSVMKGEIATTQSWRLREDRESFEEETVEILD